jgi:very-short-patch-repair endonuclease
MGYDHLPGMERVRERYGSIPTLAGEISGHVAFAAASGGKVIEERFPFVSWAAANGFRYPDDGRAFLQGCGSAAEAFFAREFAARPSTRFEGRVAIAGDVSVALQVACSTYRVDAVVTEGPLRLAVEVDGLGFHTMRAEQIAADYLRERRIVCAGYTVIRFTAAEVFSNSAECWRQIDAILAAYRKDPRRAR